MRAALTMLVFIVGAFSGPSLQAGEREALFTDPSGWSIVGAKRASDSAERWASEKMAGGPRAKLLEALGGFKAIEYVYHHDPAQYLILAISLPDDLYLRWSSRAEIEIAVPCAGDTLAFTSTQFLWTEGRELAGAGQKITIPGEKIWLSRKLYPEDEGEETPERFVSNHQGLLTNRDGDLLVFVRFEFGKCDPDPKRIICRSVSGITPTSRRSP